MKRFLILVACFFGLSSVTFADAGGSAPSSAEAFNEWLFTPGGAHSAEKARRYAEFQTFLEQRGVAGIVPSWQLLRLDAQYAARCGSDFFAIPPREMWSEIVPALRLVREHVIPVTGRLEVMSAWRSPAINACVNGAARSRHMEFKALDLVAPDREERSQLFADLCRLQQRVGSRTAMGLGAYYDPTDLQLNIAGRFHIDAAGYRTWGFDYTGKSNPCPKLI